MFRFVAFATTGRSVRQIDRALARAPVVLPTRPGPECRDRADAIEPAIEMSRPGANGHAEQRSDSSERVPAERSSPRWPALSRYGRRWAAPEVTTPGLCLVLCLVVGAWPDGFFETSRNWLFDVYQRLAPAERAQSHSVVIDIDAESIRRIGQWPWPRDRLARLIDAARGAKVIGIDLLLSEPDRASPENWVADQPEMAPETREAILRLPSTDLALARSIAAAPVVMAAVAVPTPAMQAPSTIRAAPIIEIGADPRPALPQYGAVVRPLPQLAEAAKGLGIVTMPPEADGVVRRVPAIVAAGNELVPSFATELLAQWLGADRILVRGDSSGIAEIAVGARALRADHRGRIWVRYARTAPARYVPAWQILQGGVDPSAFLGRIALVGVSAPGLGDVIVSPLRQPQKGLNVHVQLIESLLAQDTLWRPAVLLGAELLVAFVLGAAGIALLGRVPTGIHAAIVVSSVLLLIAVSWMLFATTGLLLDWTFPVAALAMTAVVALTARTRAEVRTRRQRESELEAALLQTEAADRAKTEFLANVSHELRTPLSAVIGFSEIMAGEMMGPLAPKYVGYARDIHSSGKHLLGIIEDVLELSVLDLRAARAGDDRVEVAGALAECARMAGPHAEARGVRIVQQVDSHMPYLRVDARMFRQMVLNLLSNAVKYSPRGAEVLLYAQLAEGWLFVAVCDRGPGISEADLPSVLRPFGRLRSAKLAQEPGVGIGLPLTKSMVELHGGVLEIRSRLAIGTEVLLWFPPSRVDQETKQ